MSENINLQNEEENVIIVTLNITAAWNSSVTFRNLEGITQIDWGDGTVNSVLNHTYANTGEYSCKIYNVTTIGEDAFLNLNNLTSAVIPNSVTTIGFEAFRGCSSLTSVVIGDSVISIGRAAFSECRSLTNVVIGNNVSSIDAMAFQYCTSLTSVVIPDGITSISSWAFYGCNSLTSVTFKGENPLSINIITDSKINNTTPIYYVPKEFLEVYRNAWAGTVAEEKIQPDPEERLIDLAGLRTYHKTLKEQYLNSMATQDWVNERFKEGISQPDYEQNDPAAADYIKNRPFYAEESIVREEIINETISESYKEWSIYTNFSEKDIFDVTFDGVEYFGLTCRMSDIDIHFFGNLSILEMGDDTGEPFAFIFGFLEEQTMFAFVSAADVSEGVPLIVAITGIGTNIKYLDEKFIPDTIVRTRALDRQQKEIDGKVVIATFNITEAHPIITLQNLEDMTEIDWGDGVIDNKLSHKYANAGKYKCKIYDVTAIGKSAFEHYDNLTSIEISDSVTSIGQRAFYGCSSLTSIEIPDSVLWIGTTAFYGCIHVTSVVIGNSLTAIGGGVFYNCNSLTSIEIPDNVTTIINEAFSACNNLINIKIPNSVTSIGNSAFSFCKSLINIVIPDSVTSIGDSAFKSCSNLVSATFKNPVPIDYNYSFPWFGDCPSLTHIYIPYGCKQAYIDKWMVEGASQEILDKIVESDREAMMSDVVAKQAYSNVAGSGGTDGEYHARVYGVKYDGTEETIPVANQAKDYSICWRDADANIYVGDPTQVLHCVNKRYAEANFVAKPTGSGVIYSDGSGNFSTRSIVGGEPKPWTIVERTYEGRVKVGTPTENNDATTKKYVDDLVANSGSSSGGSVNIEYSGGEEPIKYGTITAIYQQSKPAAIIIDDKYGDEHSTLSVGQTIYIGEKYIPMIINDLVYKGPIVSPEDFDGSEIAIGDAVYLNAYSPKEIVAIEGVGLHDTNARTRIAALENKGGTQLYRHELTITIQGAPSFDGPVDTTTTITFLSPKSTKYSGVMSDILKDGAAGNVAGLAFDYKLVMGLEFTVTQNFIYLFYVVDQTMSYCEFTIDNDVVTAV